MTDTNPLVAELQAQDDARRKQIEDQVRKQVAGDDPRNLLVNTAGDEMWEWIMDWKRRHGLTSVEFLFVMQVASNRHMREMLQAERAGVK